MRCAHCEARLADDPFTWRGLNFCCECMSALTSWLLDGGTTEDPALFPELAQPEGDEAGE